jgi:hypothetical protein
MIDRYDVIMQCGIALTGNTNWKAPTHDEQKTFSGIYYTANDSRAVALPELDDAPRLMTKQLEEERKTHREELGRLETKIEDLRSECELLRVSLCRPCQTGV